MAFACRAFCTSTRRTLESDPGSGSRVPSPDLKAGSPAALPGINSAGPKSIRNLATFPPELYIAIHCCEPSALGRRSKSNATYATSGGWCSIAEPRSATRLHPGNNTNARAAVRSNRIIRRQLSQTTYIIGETCVNGSAGFEHRPNYHYFFRSAQLQKDCGDIDFRHRAKRSGHSA